MVKKLKQTEYAYIAGYIDGDGCFDIQKQYIKSRPSPRYSMAIIVSSANPGIIEWLRHNLGGSQRCIKSPIYPRKSVHYFILRKKKAIPFCMEIKDHLIEKVEQANCFIRFATIKECKDKDTFIRNFKILKDTNDLASRHHVNEFMQHRLTVEPTEIDFAYLAGFIDAECCLGIQKNHPKDRPNPTYKIQLQCNDTKAPVFKYLIERFGGFLAFNNRIRHQKARRNQLAWSLAGNALSKILDKIYPFLKHKKPVCKELMKFYATTLRNGGARHTEIFRSEYAKVLDIREAIVTKIHKLNSKGTKNS